MTGRAEDDLSERTDELVKQGLAVTAATIKQVDRLDQTIAEMRRWLAAGGDHDD